MTNYIISLNTHCRRFLKKHSIPLTILFLLLISTLIVLPEFPHGSFSISTDGKIHIARFQQVFLSLKSLHFPPLISFVGLQHIGSALPSMYPWITTVIFVIPYLIFANPVTSLALGFILCNFITGINVWILCQYLTKNRTYQLLGITFYLFNSYHLELLYARMAIGELLAYAFFPLVLLGCLKIWNRPTSHANWGWIYLVIGMVGVTNSHLLSLLLITIMLSITEICRLLLHKISENETKYFVIAAILTFVLSIYPLSNFVYGRL